VGNGVTQDNCHYDIQGQRLAGGIGHRPDIFVILTPVANCTNPEFPATTLLYGTPLDGRDTVTGLGWAIAGGSTFDFSAFSAFFQDAGQSWQIYGNWPSIDKESFIVTGTDVHGLLPN